MNTNTRHCNVRASLLTLARLSLIGAAQAQAQDQAQPEGNTLMLGLGLGFGAKYAGSKKIEGGVMPGIDYSMSNGFYASTLRGIGWGGQSGPFGYSAGLGLRGGREDRDKKKGLGGGGANELLGMGEIKTTATLNLGVSYNLMDAVELSAGVELPLSKGKKNAKLGDKALQHGTVFRLGASAGIWGNDSSDVSIELGATAGDKKYMQTFFGVTPEQAAATKFKAYAPKAGFHSVEASINWNYKIDKKWGVVTSLGVNHLLGDAGKSPIVQRKSTPTGMVMLTYLY
ncbi:MipA/OmpV family protein [Paucibacter sp. XJ19-41]|uniref:MipA/OmpV family protein n=1 Tax=Paucibacter sp. XJ19-41 TaxID=2927824 RepID=UPI0023497FCC|nr:MipA/OmpV family protein [Paucibacter sp. XJ19-41]MDC6165809.1 MipA/OmpV family protein [Paucibacter sp. XJ19-41]